MTDITSLIIKVESQGAKKAEGELAALEAQGAKTEKATDALSKTTKKASASADDMARAASKWNETAQQRADRIHKVVEASLAQQKATDAAALSERALREQEARNVATKVELSAATRRAISAQEAAMGITEGFTFAEAESAVAHEANAAAMDTEAASALGLKAASGGAIREYTALLDEVISGRTSRTPGTLAVLGGRLGLTQKLFSSTGLAILGTVAATGALLEIITKAEAEESRFNNAVQLTGGYLGVTDGQFRNMAQDIANGVPTIGEAKAALLEVANTGQFTGKQIEQIGKAALAMSHVTGKAVKDSIAEFVKMGKDPVQSALKLDQQYHFLTNAIFDQIQALQTEGRTEQATELLRQQAGQAFEQRADNMEKHLGILQREWAGMAHGASKAWDEILHIGAQESPAEKLADQLAAAQKKLDSLTTAHISGRPAERGRVYNPGRPATDSSVIAAQAEVDRLQAQLDAARKKAAQEANEKAQQTAANQASAAIHDQLMRLDKTAQHEAAIRKLNNEFAALAKVGNLPAGVTQTASGFKGGEYDTLLADINKKYAAHKTAISGLTQESGLPWLGANLDAATKYYSKLADLRAKDLANLEASLQTEGEAANAGYAKTYNRILKDTEGNPGKRKDLLARLFQQYGNKATSGLEQGGQQSFLDKEQAIQAEYERERAMVLANTKLTQDQKTALEIKLTKARNAELAALQSQHQQQMLSASASLFDGLAGLAYAFGGKSSGAFKALFAVSKGFAIAKAIINIETGVTSALADVPFPANIIAAAATAAKGAAMLATIKSTSFSGAYDAGGYIPSGKFGLVGEVGPELVAGPAQITSRADTAKALGGQTTNINYAPHYDNRGAGPDEVAKLVQQFRRERKWVEYAVDYRLRKNHWPTVA